MCLVFLSPFEAVHLIFCSIPGERFIGGVLFYININLKFDKNKIMILE